MLKSNIKNLDVQTIAIWEKKKEGFFVTTNWKKPVPFSCPPVFGGNDQPSPEDLFLSAIATCTLTTILHLCDSLHTTPKSLSVTTKATLEFNKENNDFFFSVIKCLINIHGESFLLERACELIPKYCVIGKNIKPKVTYEVNINQ
ncbi:MAG: OsmC family protein [Promethearchaeota archaeon]